MISFASPPRRSTSSSARAAPGDKPLSAWTSSAQPGHAGGCLDLVYEDQPARIQAAEWLVKEVRLATSLAYLREEFDIAQGLVADGRIRCAELHTSTVSLHQMANAFERLSDSPQEIKVLVDPRL